MNDNQEKELLTFPCEFPIKVMGLKQDTFAETIGQVIKEFDPTFNPETITVRDSRQGHYQALQVVVQATSREQLDSIYMALTHHPMVKVVL